MNSRNYHTSQLAKFLRINGDKVINGTCKLSLTTSALCLLNSIFSDILSHGNEDNTSSNSRSQRLYEDAKFLYDFIKKTPSLKLFHDMQTLRGGVDLTNFSNLTVLELHKVPTHLLVGLDNFCSQLKVLICSRSLSHIKELFANCENESNSSCMWTEMQELDISHNYLEGFDHTLNYLPSIEYFNASYNNLKYTDEIQVLQKLVVVNLSYNLLENLPYLCSSCCFSVKALFIRNNILEDISGLECLLNLEEFDVSYNCLSTHIVLKPLEKLKLLRKLHLEGNPLYFHKKHRALTIKYFHPNVIANGISLNGKPLSKEEILNAVNKPVRINADLLNFHQTSINVIVEDTENKLRPVDQFKTFHNDCDIITELSTSCKSEVQSLDKTIILENNSIMEEEVKIEKKLPEPRSSKMKERKVKIEDPVEITSDDAVASQDLINLTLNDDGLTSVPSHMQTKQLFENRRKEYGKEWLIPSRAFPTLAPPSCDNTPAVPSSTPVLNEQHAVPSQKTVSAELLDEKLLILVEEQPLVNDAVKSANVLTSSLHKANNAVSSAKNNSGARNDERRQSQACSDIVVLDELPCELSEQTFDACCFNEEDYSNFNLDDSDEEESEDRIFVVDKDENGKHLSLLVIIGDKFIKEKDFITGKSIDVLDLRSLLSVAIVKSEENDVKKTELHLSFETVKTSRQKRVYSFEDLDSAQRMLNILQPFADAKTLQDVILGALQCLKCNSQFSKQGACRKVLKTMKPYYDQDMLPSSYDSSKGYYQEVDLCPNCGSNMVVETETVPLPGMSALTDSKKVFLQSSGEWKFRKPISEDNSSIGSHSSRGLFANLFSSKKSSPTVTKKQIGSTSKDGKSDSSFTNGKKNQSGASSSIRSASETCASVHEEADVVGDMHICRNSSGATINSNISQSSIAVISDTESNIANAILEKDPSYLSWFPSIKSPPDSCQKSDPSSATQSEIFSADSSGTYLSPSKKCEVKSYVSSPTGEPHSDFYSVTESFENNNQYLKETNAQSEEHFSSTKNTNVCDNFITQVSASSSATGTFSDANESLKLIDLFTEKENFSSEVFTSVDHRLKLHFEIDVFKHDEEFEACLEADIVLYATAEQLSGFLIVSSKRIFIVKITNNNSDSWDKRLKQIHFCPLNQIKSIHMLLGSQGFIIKFGTDNKVFLLIIKDADLCNCFLSYLTDILKKHLDTNLPEFVAHTNDYLSQLHEEIITKYYPVPTNQEKEVLLYLLALWKNSSTETSQMQSVCVVISLCDIFIVKLQFKKPTKQNKNVSEVSFFSYAPLEMQKICNLVSVRVEDNFKTAEFLFLDEDNNCENHWKIQTHTKSSLFSLINSLKSPWESIFKIEFPLFKC